MNITHEILHVLAKEDAPLCMDDLVGTLTQPENNAIVWNNRMSQSLRALVELDFVRKTNSLTHTYYEIAPQGTLWLKIDALPDVATKARKP